MKPAPFKYERCESIDHATSLLAEHGDDASILAGGQSLVALMNLRFAAPSVLLDIARLTELDVSQCSPDEVRLGAMTRARFVERSAEVGSVLPVLQDAISQIGHPQIRSRTTIGGNIAHADPASELPALLLGLDGEVEFRSQTGTRVVPAADLFEGMWETSRQPTEVLTSVRFPTAPQLRKRFVEFARRPGDFALAGAFVGVEVDEVGTILDIRLAFCGVDSTPIRLSHVEAEFRGETATADLPDAVAASVRSAVDPVDMPDCPAAYRRNLCGVLAGRALSQLIDDGDEA